MIDRLFPTLFYVGCGFILCLLCVAVYVAVAAYDDRRAARDAERAARPHSAHTGTAVPAQRATVCTCGDAGECFRPTGHYADCPVAAAGEGEQR